MNAAWLKFLPGGLRNRLEGRFSLQQAVGNSGWLLLDRAVRSGLGFAVMVWLARYLGPQQFGVFSYVLAFAAISNALSGFGLESIAIRELVRTPAAREEILGTAFVLRLLGAALSLTAAVTVISWLRPDEPRMAWLVGIAAAGAFFLALDVIDYWFRSAVQSKYTVLARVAAASVFIMVKAVLILLAAPLGAFVVATLAETALAGLLLAVAYRIRVGRLLDWTAARSRAVSLLGSSWPMFLSVMAVMVYMKIDQIMIGELLGARAVGTYSAAVRLVEIWYVIPAVVASSIFPALYRLKSDNPARYLQRVQQYFDVMVVVPLAVAVLVSLAAGPLVALVYGAEYLGATGVLQLYIWSSVFVFLMVATGSYLVAEDRTLFVLFRNILGMLVNVLLNWLFIPRYGIEGAAVATLVAYLVAAYLASGMVRDMWPLFVLESRALFLPGSLLRLCPRNSSGQPR